MLNIQSGQARDLGTDFWEIVDGNGQSVTEFRRSRFPHILNRTPVYFQDLDLDPKFCENVQPQGQVDDMVRSAIPPGGITADADNDLRTYIMAALLHVLSRQGAARTAYLAQINAKMGAVHADAVQSGGQVTVDVLRRQGISG